MATLFFDLPLSKQPTLFRKSAKADEKLSEIWQARARAQAEYLCIAEEQPAFTGVTKEQLRKLAIMSVDPQVVRQLRSILPLLLLGETQGIPLNRPAQGEGKGLQALESDLVCALSRGGVAKW